MGERHKTRQGQESTTGHHHISSNAAAFSGPVLFFPEKRSFFGGGGGGGGGRAGLLPEQQLSLITTSLAEDFSNTVKPSFTDTTLLRTLLFVPRERPYIFPKLIPLNTDNRHSLSCPINRFS